MSVDRNARRKWEKAREFALGLPGATEEFPRGESAGKVNGKVLVLLGVDDGSHPRGVTVGLVEETVHAPALAAPGTGPAGHGLRRSGRVRLPLGGKGAPEAGLLCDRVEESRRTIAPRRLVTELETR
ncbi:MmcQ/YjbR family DNA-binding protein [Streptomyces sp. ID05-04B]|nr:MmcQ/YjbR family DNA-binding protein [Streptomyces sp. ID05-04B]MDX5566701.1 MmcQ/YjbR family DNA-binding protein [Streptomyces sp. ID05-04B]